MPIITSQKFDTNSTIFVEWNPYSNASRSLLVVEKCGSGVTSIDITCRFMKETFYTGTLPAAQRQNSNPIDH